MKGYKRYYFILFIFLILYFVAQYYKPREVDWRISLSAKDKIPYGSFIVYDQLKTIYPQAEIKSVRVPVYNVVNNSADSNTAYLLVDGELQTTKTDEAELLNYVSRGNYVFLAAAEFSKTFKDTLSFEISDFFIPYEKDSAAINFVNPLLKQDSNYRFYKNRIDGVFSKIDTANTLVLGINQQGDANFIKRPFGNGAFFIHCAPLCFTNYFALYKNNAQYIANALSYIPAGVSKLYWDEYYKLGPTGATTPLRFFLNNTFLKWALWLSIGGMYLFVLFEMKRRQRIIAVAEPLKNTSLEFVEIVGSVYFNQKDNLNIALKKISFFKEFLRSRFYLSTLKWDEEFISTLVKKTGIAEREICELIKLVNRVQNSTYVIDEDLLLLNETIDNFYTKAR